MQLDAFLEKMNPTIHQALKLALELGKWPDGRPMTSEERDAALQALIVYEHDHLPESERVGYMPGSCKKTSQAVEPAEESTILRFKD